MKKYQSIEAKRERIAELESLISGTEKGIRALEDYITRCDLANAEGEEWDTEDIRRLLVKTYQAREEYRNERYALIEELHDTATEAAAALCTAYEEATNSPADYLAAYHVAREEILGTRPATVEQRGTVADMVEIIAARHYGDMANKADTLINNYAVAIGEPTPAYMCSAAYRVAFSKDAAPVHHDEVAFMQKVIKDHETDPDALRELFKDLKAGAVVMM